MSWIFILATCVKNSKPVIARVVIHTVRGVGYVLKEE